MATPQPQVETTRAAAHRRVPTDLIRVRKGHNFRQEFGQEELEELAESIKTHDVLEPLLLRYVKSHKGSLIEVAYELVAGERRLRAAKLAGLKDVPAIVRELTDAQADEIMVLENLQRVDLNDLEYAEGFDRLITTHGYTIEQLAKRAHKGTTFIRDLLHLVNLPECAREGLLSGRISKSVGVLISTVPDEGQRKKFAEEVLQGGRWKQEHAMSFRSAKDWKEQNYMKVLSGAPFPLDEQLDPAWPHSCRTCPHFAGNSSNGTAKQGKRSDICLNPPHFETLVQIARDRALEKATAAGKKVLSKSDTEKVFYKTYDGTYQPSHNSREYVPGTENFMDYGNNYNRVPWGQVAKKAGAEPLLAVTPDGRTHKLYKRSELEAAAKQQGYKLSASSSNSRSRKSVASADNDGSAKARTSAVTALLKRLMEFSWEKASIDKWRQIALFFVHIVDMGESAELLLPLIGVAEKEADKYGSVSKFVPPYLKKLKTTNEIQAFIATAIVADRLQPYTEDFGGPFIKEDLALATAFGIDLKALQRDALKALKAFEKTTMKTPAKRAKKAR